MTIKLFYLFSQKFSVWNTSVCNRISSLQKWYMIKRAITHGASFFYLELFQFYIFYLSSRITAFFLIWEFCLQQFLLQGIFWRMWCKHVTTQGIYVEFIKKYSTFVTICQVWVGLRHTNVFKCNISQEWAFTRHLINFSSHIMTILPHLGFYMQIHLLVIKIHFESAAFLELTKILKAFIQKLKIKRQKEEVKRPHLVSVS